VAGQWSSGQRRAWLAQNVAVANTATKIATGTTRPPWNITAIEVASPAPTPSHASSRRRRCAATPTTAALARATPTTAPVGPMSPNLDVASKTSGKAIATKPTPWEIAASSPARGAARWARKSQSAA